ncbi:arginyltransferase [Dokdonella koreensis]|uniref:Aspartate/glutamate leucyltransferase n=1 Tax=Dokdonella koreensis DS-123 TaxID=1300342 RepID=A0A160DSY9_9GAMM|nr:arginyltransferase [Dokdonella koreensis]ANB17448.1 Arginine-tRNA-protein transferase [Dokdonella koreensis DS-123]
MRSDVVRLFQTLPHRCGYYEARSAQNLVIDPSVPQLPQLYDLALSRGYRRAGGHVYFPHCTGCRACVACRIPVDRFTPDRGQRRCIRRNADLEADVQPAGYSDERFALYQDYLRSRHLNGGMDDATPEDFARFLYTDWSPTRFVEWRLRGRLVAVAVTDFCTTGLSAVYTYFDPAEQDRGLGTFAITEQVRIARERGLPHLYLGFWINGHPKMDYKRRYRPLELLRSGRWVADESRAAVTPP